VSPAAASAAWGRCANVFSRPAPASGSGGRTPTSSRNAEYEESQPWHTPGWPASFARVRIINLETYSGIRLPFTEPGARVPLRSRCRRAPRCTGRARCSLRRRSEAVHVHLHGSQLAGGVAPRPARVVAQESSRASAPAAPLQRAGSRPPQSSRNGAGVSATRDVSATEDGVAHLRRGGPERELVAEQVRASQAGAIRQPDQDRRALRRFRRA
jgi:hypothetical protein